MLCGVGGRVNAIIAKHKRLEDRVAYENVEEERAARNPLDVTADHEGEGRGQDLWLLGGVDCKTRM